MPYRNPGLPLLFIVALAGCAAEADTTPRIDAPAAEIVGEPVRCIQTGRIDNTRVHDDYTIDFEMLGGDIYRNTLPNGCPQLGFDRRFAYELTTNRLCSNDTITVLQSGGGRGVTCGLGEFVPIRYADTEG